MILIGIMAAVALPRFDSIGSFDATGYSDQLRSVLRFAQKSALAQRRAMIVTFDGALPAVTFTSALKCSDAVAGNLTFPATLRARGGSTPSPVIGGGLTDEWICFDTMGKPYSSASTALAATGTITVGDATRILIEPETGYVH